MKRTSGDAGEEPEQRIAAVAALLIELAQRAARHIAVRADEWASDALWFAITRSAEDH